MNLKQIQAREKGDEHVRNMHIFFSANTPWLFD